MENVKKISRKKQLVVCVLVAVLAFGCGLFAKDYNYHHDPTVQCNLEITQNIGGVQSTLYSGNLITAIGENYIRDLLGFDNVTGHNATKWISLSNDASPASSWTKLANEVNANNFTRAEGTVTAWINSNHYAYNVSYTFTASDTQQLQCAGLQWSGVAESDSNLFAAAAFTQTTFNAGDTITITWSITYNAS